jgi:alpha-L-fucosidase
MTMNDTWGFKTNDHNWKSTETLIHNLVDIASKGGNYLLNVGPTCEGLIPEPSIERLKAIGNWMEVNHEAIYATKASPFKRLPWGRCTRAQDGTTLYLHVFDWPTDGKLLVPGLKTAAKKAYLLAGSKEKVSSELTAQGLVLHVPATAPDKISSTIVLKLQKPPEIEPTGIFQDFDGSLVLQASEATLHGNIIYESQAPHDNIGAWENPDDWAEWTFNVAKPGKFDVSAEVAALEKASFEVSAGDKKVRGNANATGDWTKFRLVKLGTLDLPFAGKATVTIHAVKDGWQPLNIKAVRLKPSVASP